MKKLSMLLAVLLCITMLLPTAVAESAFIPGQITNQLFADAWNSGKMISGDLKLRLDMDGTKLGMSEDEQKALAAITPLLGSATLGVAAGKIEGGVRIELDGELLSANGGNPAVASAAANLTLTGISLESNLLPGQKVTARWETLLAMAGLSDEDINVFLMLRDTDWNVLLPQLMAMAQQYVQMAVQLAAPYGQTIMTWVDGLQFEQQLNVPAADDYPAAASQLTIYLTEKDMGALITLLAQQLKADATVSTMLSALLAQSGENITVAQLCDEVIAEAATMTSTTNPITFTIGLGENGLPVYGQFFAFADDDESVFIELVANQKPTDATYTFNMMTLENSAIQDAFSITIAATGNTTAIASQLYDDGTPLMGFEYTLTMTDAAPGMKLSQNMTMNMGEGHSATQMVMTGTSSYAPVDGGEVCDTVVSTDMYSAGQAVNITALGTMSAFPTADGFTGAYGITESIPAMGVNAIGMDIAFSTAVYDPATTAALGDIALETASSETIDSLMGVLENAAQLKVVEFMQAMPADALMLMQ